MRYLELAISLFGASVHFCRCTFLRPKFFCSTKYMHFSVADHIKHVVRSAAYIQYRKSSHIHHGLQRIALSLMFLRNSVRLQCSTERYCSLVNYFMFRRLLLEIYVCRTSAGIASTAIDSPMIHIACVPLST